MSKTIEDAQNTEFGRKGKEAVEGFANQARTAAEAITKQGEQFGNSEAYKAVGKGVRAVQDNVDIGVGVYRSPEKLRKRSERSHHTMSDDRTFEPNMESVGVELHKDSKWSQSWQDFKDNNTYVNKVFVWKMKYDESDSPLVRASRLLTEKMTDLFGGMFQKTELSEVLTEITKMDPEFAKETFLKQVETDIIPNVLEAMIRGDLEILQDWCHEAVSSTQISRTFKFLTSFSLQAFNVLATPIKTAQQLGYRFDSKILDVENVELVMGKIMEHGPVLVLTFQAQQIMVIRDVKDVVVEGNPVSIRNLRKCTMY